MHGYIWAKYLQISFKIVQVTITYLKARQLDFINIR